ncbi:MAG: hypothetical protein J5842_02475, partial [Lachnospiraceae bacterium]|nr:hypothetical protein [Lachnospiraceae bacterium]
FRLSVPARLYVDMEGDEVSVVTVSGRSFSGPRSMRVLRKGFEAEMGERITVIKKESGKKRG